MASLAIAQGAFAGSPEGFVEQSPPAQPRRARTLDLNEYRVEGADQLSTVEVESALSPFLGPGRSIEDVERARAALEKAYSDRGYQSVSVAVPKQRVSLGVVRLLVTEGKVGRLRVRGSRYFSLGEIKAQAPSVAEGVVPNLNDIVRDIFALNQLPDRRVTPSLRAGLDPGTVDVDLNVQDHLPLHGSVELNDRFSANTSVPRINGTLHYDNLWQQGHSLSLSFQVAPVRTKDARVLSASYVTRFREAPGFTLTFNGVLQDSDISTLGAIAVQGHGRILGTRANFTLPGSASFFQTLTAGLDYKHFGKELESDPFATPITYFPGSLQYLATWSSESARTQFGATATFNLRGLSSSAEAFDAKRYKASGAFLYWRGELSHTHELPEGFQIYGRAQVQYAGVPLLPSEQFTAGGVESVRGYLEAQAAGDDGVSATAELRTPSLASSADSFLREFKLHAFAEGGRLAIRDALPEQRWLFILASTGAGTRFKVFDFFSASFDLGFPLRTEASSKRFHPRLQFRLWGEF